MTLPKLGTILAVTVLLGLASTAVAIDTLTITVSQTVVRAGPDNTQAILATVSHGARFALLKTQQNWYKILLDDGREGWVAQAAAQVGGEEPPQPLAPPKVLRNSLGMEFVLLPAGTFQMGSNDKEGYHNEKPVHTVHLTRPFYLGKHEVTQGQWQAVMGSNPSLFTDDPHRPVENVSWNEVQEFIRRLNAQEGTTLYRLPTEAEWEYAARAGTTTQWSFGDDASQLARHAWHSANAEEQTHPVGQLLPNPWGLYDMYGNVWEWVQDWYGEYPSDTVVDPAGPASGSQRVVRGGSWYRGLRDCRAAVRDHSIPDDHRHVLGVRLLRAAE